MERGCQGPYRHPAGLEQPVRPCARSKSSRSPQLTPARRRCVPFCCTFSVIPTTYKLNIYLKIAQLYLEDEDAVAAEAFINRASMIVHETTDTSLHIRYKVRPARTRSGGRLPLANDDGDNHLERQLQAAHRSALLAPSTTSAGSSRPRKSTWSCRIWSAKTKGANGRPALHPAAHWNTRHLTVSWCTASGMPCDTARSP